VGDGGCRPAQVTPTVWIYCQEYGWTLKTVENDVVVDSAQAVQAIFATMSMVCTIPHCTRDPTMELDTVRDYLPWSILK
jgi:hypothetical protein